MSRVRRSVAYRPATVDAVAVVVGELVALAVVGPDHAALLADGVANAVRIGDPAAAGDAARQLVHRLPDVAIVDLTHRPGTLAVRGALVAEIVAAGDSRRVDETDGTVLVDDTATVRLRRAGPAGGAGRADDAIGAVTGLHRHPGAHTTGVPTSDPWWPVTAGMVAAAEVALEPLAAAPPVADDLDLVLGPTAVRTVEGAAVRPEPGPPRPLGVLVFSSGERVVVDRTVLIGRHPDADPAPDDECAGEPPRFVRLRSRAVSRRHAAVRIDRWRLLVDDLGSANGTVVALPGGRIERVSPGHPLALAAGARVDLGGEVSFDVEEVR